MLRQLSFERIVIAAVAFAVVLFALGWLSREDPADKPYLEFLGGGFVFNYRVGEAFYGFSVKVQKPLKVGSIIEAEFEDPAGGVPHVVSKRVHARTTRYSLRSPRVSGVEADKPYKVLVRLYDFRHEEVIEQHERQYSSRIASDIVPEKPLTVGPGYHRNPELAE